MASVCLTALPGPGRLLAWLLFQGDPVSVNTFRTGGRMGRLIPMFGGEVIHQPGMSWPGLGRGVKQVNTLMLLAYTRPGAMLGGLG